MPTKSHPILAHVDLPATQVQVSAGQTLFYQGDAAEQIYWLEAGKVEIYQNGVLQGDFEGQFLDEWAVLGGLTHQVKAVAKTDCVFWAWAAADFWQVPHLQDLTRRYLAERLQNLSHREASLSAPLSYQYGESEVGAFLFDNVTMIFAFCEADRAQVENMLPPHLSLLQMPRGTSAPVLVALADFPRAYRENGKGQAFAYTETTFFVPVRHQSALGFYVPLIYPSTYEPILLGREIYGFPKQLGQSEFAAQAAHLSVNNQSLLSLKWGRAIGQDESALVGALGKWLGLNGALTGLAFQAGELLRKTARLPATRRVDVYNHKKIPAADASQYAVNQLTRCTFGVLRWYQVAQLQDLQFSSRLWDLSIRAAYRTQLDLRLGKGRVVVDYLGQSAPPA